MTDTELLRKILEGGAALGMPDGMTWPLDIAEIHDGNRLFWVSQCAEDQHHTHVTEFDQLRQVGDIGLELLRGGATLAYIAGYAEWPEINTDDAMDERARWAAHLTNPRNRDAYDRFVDNARTNLLRTTTP